MPTPDDFRSLDLRLQRLHRNRPMMFKAIAILLGTFLFLVSWLLGLLVGGQ